MTLAKIPLGIIIASGSSDIKQHVNCIDEKKDEPALVEETPPDMTSQNILTSIPQKE